MGEELRIAERLEDAAVGEQIAELEIGTDAVLEADADGMASERGGPNQLWCAAHVGQA